MRQFPSEFGCWSVTPCRFFVMVRLDGFATHRSYKSSQPEPLLPYPLTKGGLLRQSMGTVTCRDVIQLTLDSRKGAGSILSVRIPYSADIKLRETGSLDPKPCGCSRCGAPELETVRQNPWR